MLMRSLMVAALLAAPGLAQMPGMTPATPPAVAADKMPDPPAVKAQKQLIAKQLIKLMRPVWSDEQIGRIMLIGWYSGAAAMCDDLEIDQAKLGKALAAVTPEDVRLTPDRREFLDHNLTLHVGMASGVVMGTHRDVGAFSAEARQAKAELPADKHLFDMSLPPSR